MKKPLPFIVLAVYSLGTGVFWSHGPDSLPFLIEYVRPFVAGMLVSLLYATRPILKKIVLTAAVVTGIEVISAISYGLTAGWRYVTRDSETQLFLLIYFGLSLVVALATTLAVFGIQCLKRRKAAEPGATDNPGDAQ